MSLFNPPSIDVTVAHGLGVAGASSRLQKLLTEVQAGGGDVSGFIDTSKTTVTWYGDGSAASFDTVIKARIQNIPISGSFLIAPSYVRLSTSPLPYWMAPFLWYYSGKIKDKLTEALTT